MLPSMTRTGTRIMKDSDNVDFISYGSYGCKWTLNLISDADRVNGNKAKMESKTTVVWQLRSPQPRCPRVFSIRHLWSQDFPRQIEHEAFRRHLFSHMLFSARQVDCLSCRTPEQ